MLKTWAGFIEFLKDHDCQLYDETDWSYPIYKRKGYGDSLLCGLDIHTELDDFMICFVCKAFKIDPPVEHDNGVGSIIQSILEHPNMESEYKEFPDKQKEE